MKTITTYIAFKKEFFRGLLILLAILGILTLTLISVRAQSPYKQATGSVINVQGISNVHDWEMVSTAFTSDATFKVKDGQLLGLSALNFSLPVNSLKGKEKLLTDRAHKALKAVKNPIISFKLTKATIVAGQKRINATGNLTIAGVTKPIELHTIYVINEEQTIICKGTQTIKMSDYGIKAPSYMMGAMKTGNVVTIDMLLKFNKTELISKK